MRPENQNIIDYAAIGARINKERQRCGFTPKELAKKANISISAANEIERGIRRIGLINLVLIANVFDLSLDELVYGEKNRPERPYNLKMQSLLDECSEEEQNHLIAMAEIYVKAIKEAHNS